MAEQQQQTHPPTTNLNPTLAPAPAPAPTEADRIKALQSVPARSATIDSTADFLQDLVNTDPQQGKALFDIKVNMSAPACGKLGVPTQGKLSGLVSYVDLLNAVRVKEGKPKIVVNRDAKTNEITSIVSE